MVHLRTQKYTNLFIKKAQKLQIDKIDSSIFAKY